NCEWVAEVRSKLPTITFIATKDIEKGQEILHDYQWDEFPDNFV
ncbi:MAG: SET domain-containing protein, partial [Rhodospirillales bacterium]|nr:SET domain-containing protein [Rhodospirillales bacterium]